MRILFSWLKEYIDLPQSAKEIASLLTNAGLEVEGVEEIVPTFKGIVVGKVLKTEKHPNAERLTLAQVFDGEKEISLICGAPNCREGMFVALAREGATLYPEGTEKPALLVKKVQLRGVDSCGMLCSEKELGLSEEHGGILELDETFALGMSLERYCEDAVLEVSLTPNLGHCLSVLGIARELSAITGVPLRQKKHQAAQFSQLPHVPVTVSAKEGCYRYTALSLQNIQVAKSPFWLKRRLELSGIRSLNTIVDVTNYVMLEIGEPMHAFDQEKIENGIEVRFQQKNETISLLDGQTKTIPEGAVVIADEKKVLALGGVMGSINSSISDTTKSILLEAAIFSPQAIRRTAKTLGLFSESSRRFERGVDPEGTISALQFAYELMRRIHPKTELVAFNDVVIKQAAIKKISCRISRASAVLGYEVSSADMDLVFKRLKFHVHFDGQDTFTVTPPAYRHDINEEIDLIEEIVRILGIRVEKRSPAKYVGTTLPHYPLFHFERTCRKRLIAEGLQELVTCDLISPALVESVKNHPIDQDYLVKVLNPMSVEQSILRPSMLPGFLDVVKINLAKRPFAKHTLDLACFELGNVHFRKENKYVETPVFAILLCGKCEPYYFSEQPREVDFYDMKGIVENLFQALLIEDMRFEKSSISIFHPGRQVKVFSGNLQVGSFGELHPDLLRRLDIKERILFAEFDVADLFSVKKRSTTMQPLPEFPASDRDWTVTLPEAVTFGDIEESASSIRSELLESMSLIAIFRNEEKLGKDRKNVTLSFVFRDKNKTLSQAEVDQEHNRFTAGIKEKLAQKFNIKI